MINLPTKPVQLNASVPKTLYQNDFQTNPLLRLAQNRLNLVKVEIFLKF